MIEFNFTKNGIAMNDDSHSTILVLGLTNGTTEVFDYPDQIGKAVNQLMMNPDNLSFFYIGTNPDYLRIEHRSFGNYWTGYAELANGEYMDLYATDLIEAIQSVPDNAQEAYMHRTKYV